MHDQIKKGAAYHKIVVEIMKDGERREVCICGAEKCDASGKKKSKFHNRTSEYNGVIYDSQLEMRYAVELDWRLRAKDIKSWERQIRIPFAICLKCARICFGACVKHPKERPRPLWNYYVDFVVFHNDGTMEYVECKGLELTPWKRSWLLMEALFGDKENIKLTVVKQSSSHQFQGTLK